MSNKKKRLKAKRRNDRKSRRATDTDAYVVGSKGRLARRPRR